LCYVFFVARRNPQNPVNDISKLVGGWLGGSGPGTNPTAARVQSQVKEAARAADAALGGFGQAAVNDARRLSSGSGYVPSETIKAAAVNTAAAAAGYGAGKAVQVSGLAAKAANKLTRQQVIVHGTPKAIQGPTITPRAGSSASPDRAVVFGWDPSKKYGLSAVNNPVQYTQGTGKVVVAKVPKSGIIQKADGVIVSSKPAKVVAQVDPSNYTKYDAELRRQLKRAGSSINPSPVAKAKAKLAAKKAAKTRDIGVS
jgi:hypothetical protein